MYLYIFEDGTTAQSTLAPTDYDNDTIDDGILQVFTVDTRLSFIELAAGAGMQRVQKADRMVGHDELEFTVPPMCDDQVEALGWSRAE